FVLANLSQLHWSEDKPLPSTSVLDAEITRWLGQDIALTEAMTKGPAQPSPRTDSPTIELMEQICTDVFADGLPRFPEQYLYQHYRPQLAHYRFTPPLTIQSEFFGRFTLQDATGKCFEVEGEETSRALLLVAAAGHSKVALPTDRQLVMTILEEYQRDLRKLRQALVRQTHVRITNAGAAAHMTEKIWNEQPLPNWELIDT
ncbi:MAG: hypothetical protein P8X63_04050, partial [Desulfuromonadaceae bacterium]